MTTTAVPPQDLLDVIRLEFDEMPALRLTPAQFTRLWNLDREEADRFVALLRAQGFLVEDETGQLHRIHD